MNLNIFKSNKGFTLVELLVSTALVITTSTIVLAVVTSSFRGSSRVTITEDVRQNGNSALTQMTRSVQYADTFGGVSVDGSEDNYTLSCLTPNTIYHYIKVTSGTQAKKISCDDDAITINDASLIDTNKVDVNGCQIKCTQSGSASPPVIEVDFNLTQKTEAGFEKNKSLEFSGLIRMRNLNQ